ncbi:DUF819 family protein [Tenuifilum osseticum]|uniref:DUF819 family protein n=1 Tax=Tenuifilum osseticum TaxID=3374723 RepID=UPI0034E4F319
MAQILLVLFYLLIPFVILHLCHKFPFVNKLGAVFIAYLVGLIVGNIGILPEWAGSIQDTLTTITVPLAIPLLLFSSNLKQWKSMAGKAMVSLLIGITSVVAIVIAGYFIFMGKGMADLWKVSGMLIGVYTGGTPNLASLKMMLNVDPDVYILTHTYDMIISTVFLAFLMTVGKKFFSLFLPAFKDDNMEEVEYTNGSDPFWGIFKREIFYPLLKAYGLTILIFAIAGGLSLLVPKNSQVVVVILTITTLSIVASTFKKINAIEKTFESGMYLILIFSVVVASMADISRFAGLTPGLFGYITLAVLGSLFLQVVLGKIFKVDVDTTIITSTALICSPPFVPVVAAAINNRKVILSGITIGIIGYAVGNYLGFAIAELLKTIQ